MFLYFYTILGLRDVLLHVFQVDGGAKMSPKPQISVPWLPILMFVIALIVCRFMMVLICLIFSVLSTIDQYEPFANATLFWMVSTDNNRHLKSMTRVDIFSLFYKKTVMAVGWYMYVHVHVLYMYVHVCLLWAGSCLSCYDSFKSYIS